jgi:heptosyltransferase-2
MRIGVFLPNWIGDVVMTTPALRALRKLAGSEGKMIGVMRPYVAEVLAGTRWLDEHIFYEKPASRLAAADSEVYCALAAARLDCAVLLTNSLRTAWMAWRSGAPERIGNRGDFRTLLLTTRLKRPLGPPNGRPFSTIDGYLRLAMAAGCEPEPPRLELATTPDDENAADHIWRQFKLPPPERVIIFNSGGAYGAAKHWPVEHFADLGRRVVAGGQFTVLVNCGPTEREQARSIARLSGDHRVVAMADCDHLPIGAAKACIRRSRALVTTDSGPRFFGIAFQRPVITLFGPTDPLLTRSYHDGETCLSLDLACQPCMERICPLRHHRCMRELSVDMVYNSLVQTLEAAPTGCAA